MSAPQEASTGSGAFRQYLPDLASPRFQALSKQNAHEYIDEFNKLHNPPWLYALVSHWKKLLVEPLKGVTNDGMSAFEYGIYAGADRGRSGPTFLRFAIQAMYGMAYILSKMKV